MTGSPDSGDVRGPMAQGERRIQTNSPVPPGNPMMESSYDSAASAGKALGLSGENPWKGANKPGGNPGACAMPTG